MTTSTLPTDRPAATPTTSTLEDTFDFLNTDDIENGFPVEKLPTLDAALDWFVDARRHPRRGCRSGRRARPTPTPAARRARAGPGPRACAARCARSPRRSSSSAPPAPARSRPSIARSTPARSSSSCRRPTAVQRRSPPRRRPDRRRPRPPADPLVVELTAGHPERIRDLRQRHLPLGLLRHLAHRPTALVRHGDLWQPGQGRPPPRPREGRRRPTTRPPPTIDARPRPARLALQRSAHAGALQEQALEDAGTGRSG